MKRCDPIVGRVDVMLVCKSLLGAVVSQAMGRSFMGGRGGGLQPSIMACPTSCRSWSGLNLSTIGF